MNKIELYPISALIYFIVLIFCVVCSYYAEKSNKKIPLTVVVIVIVLSLLSGIRADGVGTDTMAYRNFFNATLTNSVNYVSKTYEMEYGFTLIIKNTQEI